MRKFLIPLLMAGTVVPATAAIAQERQTRADRIRERAESGESDESSADRPQRRQRSEPVVRANRGNGGDAQVQVRQRAERPARQQRVEREASSTEEKVQRTTRGRRSRGADGQILRVVNREPDAAVQVERAVETRSTNRSGFDGLRERIVERGDRSDNDRRWSGNWRHDHRYNWRRYRDHNRSLFRFGNYYDPYGWDYRRFSVGYSMWPNYYRSSYWLNDPWSYRLPPSYGPYRWVRYYDDALLVNIYTGRVADVVHSFFW